MTPAAVHVVTATGGHAPVWVQVPLRPGLPPALRDRLVAAGGLPVYYCFVCHSMVGLTGLLPAV